MSQANIDALYEDAKNRAANKDWQALVKPSQFGWKRTAEDTNECLDLLRKDPRFKSVRKIGKDMLDVVLAVR